MDNTVYQINLHPSLLLSNVFVIECLGIGMLLGMAPTAHRLLCACLKGSCNIVGTGLI